MDIRHMPGDPESARQFRWSDVIGKPVAEEPAVRRSPPAVVVVVFAAVIVAWWFSGGRGSAGRTTDSELWPLRYDVLATAIETPDEVAADELRTLAGECRTHGGAQADALLFALLWALTEHDGGANTARELVADLDADAFPASSRLAAEW